MRRFLASSAVVAGLIQPLTAFAAPVDSPSALLKAIKADTSARSFTAETHVHVENMWISLWMSGAGEGDATVESAKAQMKATIDVEAPEEHVKVRMKFEVRATDGVAYLKLDSLEGTYDDDIARAAVNASLKKWVSIELPADEFQQEIDGSDDIFNELFDMSSETLNDAVVYRLNLKRAVLRDMLRGMDGISSAAANMEVRMSLADMFQSLSMKGEFTSNEVEARFMATAKKMSSPLTVAVPAGAVSIEELMSDIPALDSGFIDPWSSDDTWEDADEWEDPAYPEYEEPVTPARPSVQRTSRRLLRQQVEAERAEHVRNRPVLSPVISSADPNDIADHGLVWGKEDAPMTIVEFGDYECPFCRMHFTNTLPEIVQDYVETGKVRYVFRNYPLSSIHEHAMDAALAVQCALEQGNDEGIEMHDLVYTADMEATSKNLETWAKTIDGLNLATWKTCIKSTEAMDAIGADMAAAEAAGLTGTPFFFIIAPDGSTEIILGSQPYDVFNEVIEILLTR